MFELIRIPWYPNDDFKTLYYGHDSHHARHKQTYIDFFGHTDNNDIDPRSNHRSLNDSNA